MNSRDYWIKREAEQLKHNITDEAEYNRQIRKIYRDMLDACQKEIESFYAKYASAEGISIAEAKKRVALHDVKAFERKAKRYVQTKDFSKKANEELRLYNATMKINRLEMLKANIGLELISGHDELEKFMSKILKGRTEDELKRQAGILGKTIRNNAQKAHAIVNGSFHNGTFSERIWQYQDLMRQDLGRLLQTGLIQGKNPRAITKGLEKYWYGADPKTGGGATYCMERLMRTELARVQTEAQKQSFARNGFDMYTFICNENPSKQGTCPVCRGLNGKHFNVSEMMPGTNAPPMHPNCRCSTAAYEDSKDYEAWLDHLANGGSTEEWNKLKQQPKKTAAMKRDPAKFRKQQQDETASSPSNVPGNDRKELEEALSSCKTAKEVSEVARKYFKEKSGCKIGWINFEKVDPIAAKEMVLKLDDLDSRFKSSLTTISARYMGTGFGGKCTPTDDSFAKYLETGNPEDMESAITLNSEYLRSKKIIQADFNNNHRSKYGGVAHCSWADERYASVASLVHEYGHSILPGKANEIHIDNGGTNPTFISARRLYRQYIRKLSDLQRQINDVRFQYAGQEDGLAKGLEAAKDLQAEYDSLCISSYSKESVGEFIAEAFADYELSENPKSISAKLYELLVKSYGKGE